MSYVKIFKCLCCMVWLQELVISYVIFKKYLSHVILGKMSKFLTVESQRPAGKCWYVLSKCMQQVTKKRRPTQFCELSTKVTN